MAAVFKVEHDTESNEVGTAGELFRDSFESVAIEIVITVYKGHILPDGSFHSIVPSIRETAVLLMQGADSAVARLEHFADLRRRVC